MFAPYAPAGDRPWIGVLRQDRPGKQGHEERLLGRIPVDLHVQVAVLGHLLRKELVQLPVFELAAEVGKFGMQPRVPAHFGHDIVHRYEG